jgi:predicted RNase H-like nuclease (RuvC/YqgF family)
MALDAFRRLGGRKTFIDEVNTKRKETYTGLSALPHSHPELPSDFAEAFFRRDRAREEDPTIESLAEEIKELQDVLAGKEQALARLHKEAEEAAREQKDRDKDEKKKKLAQVQKDLEEKQKEAAALAAELDEA